jgi:hypothetical protein
MRDVDAARLVAAAGSVKKNQTLRRFRLFAQEVRDTIFRLFLLAHKIAVTIVRRRRRSRFSRQRHADYSSRGAETVDPARAWQGGNEEQGCSSLLMRFAILGSACYGLNERFELMKFKYVWVVHNALQ